jgi:predicted RND superfamily exporter protein
MNYLIRLVVLYPKVTIALVLSITGAMLGAISWRGIEFDGSPRSLARNDSALAFYNEVNSTFGDDRVIIVALTTSDVFTPEFIQKVERLTRNLGRIPGVDEVLSLTNVKSVRRDESGIVVGNLIPRTVSPDELESLKQTVVADPLYVRQYISADGRTTALNVFLEPLKESERRDVAEQVERVATSEAGGDEVLLAGVPLMDARGISNMVRDMMVCSPISALLCFVVFLFAFRSLWGAILPMAALIIGLIWTQGVMGLVGRPITLATLSLPTTLLAVGSSYLFHILNQYRISVTSASEEPTEQKHDSWIKGLVFIAPAVLISGTTTMAGFGSLASSSVPTVKDMGIFEALGVLFMLILTLTLVPAVLSLKPGRILLRRSADNKDYATWLNGLLHNITALVIFRRRSVLVVSLMVTAIVGFGALRLRADTDYLRIFPSSSDTVRSAEKIEERLAGVATVHLVITGQPGSITQPGFLQSVAAVQDFALRQKGVDAAVSVVDLIKRFNRVLENNERADSIPNDPARINHIVNDFLAEDEGVKRLVNGDHSKAVVVLRTSLFSSSELRRLTDAISLWSAANVTPVAKVQATGSFVLLNDASDEIAASQSTSLVLALLSIYLMMVILFRSFGTGLLALLPNLLPIVCFFGLLGWAGIRLDITSSLVASAALGLAVDNAVHMIRRYRQCTKERGTRREDEGWAMWSTMLKTGKPMVLANVMLAAAFLLFVLSSFVPVRTAGLLWGSTILSCLAANLIFLPALMKTNGFSTNAFEETETSTGNRAEWQQATD